MKLSKEELRASMLLYAVTDRAWLKEGESLTDVCRSVLAHGATFLQLREKELDPAALVREAAELKALCAEYRVPFMVNDSVEAALAADADGVHVGQSDIQGRDIRAMIGPDRILGISAGTVKEALAAERAGADYLGVGAVFGTSTKRDARCVALDQLREIAAAVSIPVVAIGGINTSNLGQLAGTGADGAAVVSAIFAAQDPGAAAAELLRLSREALGREIKSGPVHASVAVQVLPGVSGDREVCRIVDEVIAYIASTGLRYQVGPFETTIEGEDYDRLMDVVKECQHVALRAGAPKVSAYVKVVCRPEGGILTIDQKIGKYHPN